MRRILNEDEVKAAELAVSHCFEVAGTKKLQTQVVIQYAKSSGLHRAEIKEARKRLGVVSENQDGEYWWLWPDDTEPDEVNKQKSMEMWE